jgi:riboflavin synthase
MFTGIVTDLGRLRAVERPSGAAGDARFVFETAYQTADIPLGASIACSGACLTLVGKGPGWFAADVSGETLSKTTLGDWQAGTPVNFERALRLGDELGGHLVSGHVDGVATLRERREEGGSIRLEFAAPKALMPFLAAKGSVVLEGVSLTVNTVADGNPEGRFTVNIVPHTAQVTTLGACRPGARVNLEIDLLARYLQRLLAAGETAKE